MANPIISVGVQIEDDRRGLDRVIEGLTENASHVDVGVHSVSGEELVVIASANEFGAHIPNSAFGDVTIPPRPYIRSAVDDNRSRYERLAASELNAVLDGRKGVREALALIGLEMETDIKKRIVDLKEPANAPATLHPSVGGVNPSGKKSDNPLVDTGNLLGSIRYVVKSPDGQAVDSDL